MSYYNYDFCLPDFMEGLVNAGLPQATVNLGTGTYDMTSSLVLKDYNLTIKGNGKNKTFIKITKDIYLPVGIHSVFKIIGDFGDQVDNQISVEISDLTIYTDVSQEDANLGGTSLTGSVTHILELRNVKSFVMRNVNIINKNVLTTCVDIRRGFNIDITDCVIANYNRRSNGGGLWLRGDTVNVSVQHCDFYKYGGDELIGIWGTNNFEGYNIISEANQLAGINEIHKKNINICHNRIFCQDENGGENTQAIITENGNQWEGMIERLITIYTNQDSNTVVGGAQNEIDCHFYLHGIHFDDNEVFVNSPISHLMTVALDKHTTFKDITINNNIIKYGNWTTDEFLSGPKKLVDFSLYYDTIYDYSQIPGNYDSWSDEMFCIIGNTIECGSNARTQKVKDNTEYYEDDHRCLDMEGVKVLFNENRVIYTRPNDNTPDLVTSANRGIKLFSTSSKGGSVIFNNNYCKGLMLLMKATKTTNNNESMPFVNLIGSHNFLHGNPRIVQQNVDECHVSLIGNELISDYQLFLISEFAKTGTVIFNGNRVFRDLSIVGNYSTPKCQIFYTGTTDSDTNIESLQFMCCNNIFENVIYASLTYHDLQVLSSIVSIHKNNIFADIVE